MLGSMFFYSHKGEKILYDQLNIENMKTLLPINDDVGNGGTQWGKQLKVKEDAASALNVAAVCFLEIVRKVTEEGSYS